MGGSGELTETCVCVGDRRKDGFASEWRDGFLWWVCAACRKPTAPWLAAMVRRGRTDVGEEVSRD